MSKLAIILIVVIALFVAYTWLARPFHPPRSLSYVLNDAESMYFRYHMPVLYLHPTPQTDRAIASSIHNAPGQTPDCTVGIHIHSDWNAPGYLRMYDYVSATGELGSGHEWATVPNSVKVSIQNSIRKVEADESLPRVQPARTGVTHTLSVKMPK